ncbi:Clathrin interactor EPSIN 3 [Capsicum baccatum]|uniref:Clathrin interactor EPSIN 3 n=1 Tax=Capsicum baccatum TaxID=33114 RepID=A0A2G2V6L6_CAPBA|nr:Clathrin interactor EPSIN 3 [Capsicum baccatum]
MRLAMSPGVPMDHFLQIWLKLQETRKHASTVLDYLVANVSERVIDEIREHAYQISTLSDFQYIDSSGKDQGNNVRKKSQSLVVLVNDKERIQEVRQKAATFGDPYSLDGDRYGRCYDDRSRDGNRDDDHRGRSRSVDNYSNGSRSRSSDRNGDHAYDDDNQYSSSCYLLPTVEAVQGLRIALKMEGDIIESF